MNAKTKGEVAVGRCARAFIAPRQIQHIRVFKLRRVAVGGADAQGEQGTLGQVNTRHPASFNGAAIAELVGRFKTQEFIDSKR